MIALLDINVLMALGWANLRITKQLMLGSKVTRPMAGQLACQPVMLPLVFDLFADRTSAIDRP